MLYEKSCGAVVVDRSGPEVKYLLVLHHAGHWAPPKGHIEEGEDEQMTARREIKEETCLDVEMIGEFRAESRYAPKPDVMKTVIFFLAKPVGGELKCDGEECADVRWFSLEDAKAVISHQDTRDVLDEADAYLRSMV